MMANVYLCARAQMDFFSDVCVSKINWSLTIRIRFAGFDAVTLANNHFNDFGAKGANFTVEVLKKTGVKYFGVSHGQYDNSQVLLKC